MASKKPNPAPQHQDDLGLAERPSTRKPRRYEVVLHNDDYTTQEFVVYILETVFNKPQAEAFAIMMRVHQSGLGIAGIYTRDVAETKVKAARQLAEQNEFPLLVTMEPEPQEQRA